VATASDRLGEIVGLTPACLTDASIGPTSVSGALPELGRE